MEKKELLDYLDSVISDFEESKEILIGAENIAAVSINAITLFSAYFLNDQHLPSFLLGAISVQSVIAPGDISLEASIQTSKHMIQKLRDEL